jgi:hypothetical protein
MAFLLGQGARSAAAGERDCKVLDRRRKSVVDVLGREPQDEVPGALQSRVLHAVAAIALRVVEVVPGVELDGDPFGMGN